MESQVIAIAIVLLTFHGEVIDACCLTLTLPAGLYFTKAPVSNAQDETVSVACQSGYVATGGSNNGKCGNNCQWSWGTGNGVMLQCTKGCLAPNLTQGVEYVAGNADTFYSAGTFVSLQCSTNYGFKAGSSTGSCNVATSTWTWPTGQQLQCDPVCPALTLTLGVEFATGYLEEFTLGDVITLRCKSGYASTGGAASATCMSSNTWQWNGAGMLQCSLGCLAPSLTTGVQYVSGNAATTYSTGSNISLKCSTTFGYKSGSYNGTCSNTLKWTWSTGNQLQCDPVCPAPILPIGTEFASGSSLEYTVNDVITLRCSSGYASAAGGTSAVCLSSRSWQWDGTGQLQCLPACLPPAIGISATISASFAKDIYFVNDAVQFECVSGYVPLSGSATGVCSSINHWTWQAGTATSLNCVIAPPYKNRTSDTFKPSTCQSYVTRSTPTSSLCLISCLNDGYCRGYAFNDAACYLDRPFIETAIGSSMPCLARTMSNAILPVS